MTIIQNIFAKYKYCTKSLQFLNKVLMSTEKKRIENLDKFNISFLNLGLKRNYTVGRG
jgi:hypothetical protein